MKSRAHLTSIFLRTCLIAAIVAVVLTKLNYLQHEVHAQDTSLAGDSSSNSENTLTSIQFAAKSKDIDWHKIEPGYEIARVRLGVTSYLISSELLVVKIDPKKFDLQLVRSSDHNLELQQVREMTTKSKALVGINTHFFDPSSKPLGLLIRNGKTEHRIQHGGSVLTGVFYLKKKKAKIVHRNSFSDSPDIVLALQAGPRLIENGKAVTLKAKISGSRRSGIAVTKSGELLLFATFLRFPGTTLPQIQEFLLRPELEVLDALNLDGGGSSQLFVVANGASQGDIYISGGDPVPVGLVVKRR